MNRIFRVAGWMVLGTLGAGALGAIALHRGEPLNATWFVVAAVCCYLVAYRLYSAFVAAKILALDARIRRACPATLAWQTVVQRKRVSGR